MKSQVTTKVGDKGTTRALDGNTYPKCHVIMDCVGTVDELRAHIAVPLEPRLEALHLQHFAAENDVAQRQLARRVLFGLNQLAERAGRLVEHRDLFLRQQFVKCLR